MPVTCKMINGSWRLVDKDGKIKHKHKHKSRASCMRQARAINVNLELADPLVFDDMQLAAFSNIEDRTFEKELIYEGEFKMGNGAEFSITRDSLDHWVGEYDKLVANGIDVPVPKEHTNDPEANRGFVKDMYVKEREDGKAALFGKIEFRDDEAAKMATSSNVSIFSPPSFNDGKGNEYVRPIRHVALTNYPVIPGLGGFEAISASLVEPGKGKEAEMPFKDLAENIGLKLSDDVLLDEDETSKAIVASFNDLQSQIEDLKKQIPTKEDPIRVSKAQIEMLRENRELKLSRLVESGKISPAVSDKIKEVFCKDSVLTLCLSEDFDDHYNDIISALGENEIVMSFKEKTPPQVLRREGGQTVNPLIADAERRAKTSAN